MITSLHEQDYSALEMILNAENNMHSALVAVHSLVYTDPKDPEFAKWQGRYQEQVRLAKTQADASRAIAEKYNDAFKDFQHPHSKRTIFENFSDFESNYRVWSDLSEQAIDKLQKTPVGQRKDAMNKIKDAESSFEAAESSIVEISQLLRVKADKVIENSRFNRLRWQQNTIITISVTVAFMLLCYLLLTKTMSNSLRRTLVIAERVADGDLRPTERTRTAKDEIGKLAVASHNMADSLRSLILQVTHMAENVSHSSVRVAESTSDITKSTQQIAGELDLVSSGSEMTDIGTQEMNHALLEMASGIQRIAETSTLVAEASQETAEEAEQGNQAIQNAIRQMNTIREAADRSAGQVQQLGEHSNAIEQIVVVINGIAEQTNLLALNAAIEAARAGEQGRGFAVVAEEVRKLADQSQSFTAKIADLIGEVRTQTEHTVKAMDLVTREVHAGINAVDTASVAFQNILEAAKVVADQIQEITAASEEMSAGSEQVTASVDELSRIAKETSKSAVTCSNAIDQQTVTMSELRELSDSLATLARELNGALTRFQV
ncbi:MAG: HAMP domain-containing methyl-accepting chemotaxis protein [Tumebacillaceae bacterium]